MKFFANDGEYHEHPFPQFMASHKLGARHWYVVWLPIVGAVPLVERDGTLVPADDHFKVVRSRKSSSYLIIPAEDQSKTVLAFIGDEAGFRGMTGLVPDDTTATVLKQASTHAACSGNLTVVALLKPGERVVTFSYGRGKDDRTVYENLDGQMSVKIYTAKQCEIVRYGVPGPEDWEEIL